MMGDPTKVHFQVWFIPESGIEQPPSRVGTAVGYEAAAAEARKFMDEDFQEPEYYGAMYTHARAELQRWYDDSDKWVVAVPVHYGTLVIA